MANHALVGEGLGALGEKGIPREAAETEDGTGVVVLLDQGDRGSGNVLGESNAN